MQNNKHYRDSYDRLRQKYHLSQDNIDLFCKYTELLHQSTCNVTTITSVPEIIAYHFADSLELGTMITLTNQTIIDVGSGGGFPGIPLKIAYPDCHILLIEVIAKKREFLHEVIATLNLKNITVEDKDWRTFLRTTHYPADLVCARASLAPRELMRMFQPNSPYKHASLIYWASAQWQPTEHERAFVQQEYPYHVGKRDRKLVLFKK